MGSAARRIGAVSVLLILMAGGERARAQVLALNSSFVLTAQTQADYAPVATSSVRQTQGSTAGPLSVSIAADSASPGEGARAEATANVAANWSDRWAGQVSFTNVGGSTVGATGYADLEANASWTYTFTPTVTGTFVIDYQTTAQGSSSTLSNPALGLNGIDIYCGLGAAPPQNLIFSSGLNAAGRTGMKIDANETYTIEIEVGANIVGDLGTTGESISGTFDFDVQPSLVTPEPSTSRSALVAALLGAGGLWYRHRRRSPAQSRLS
jgi:hypothetical protein